MYYSNLCWVHVCVCMCNIVLSNDYFIDIYNYDRNSNGKNNSSKCVFGNIRQSYTKKIETKTTTQVKFHS